MLQQCEFDKMEIVLDQFENVVNGVKRLELVNNFMSALSLQYFERLRNGPTNGSTNADAASLEMHGWGYIKRDFKLSAKNQLDYTDALELLEL